MDYKGYKEICLTDNELAKFYSDYMPPVDLKENEYLVLMDCQNQPIDYYRMAHDKLIKVPYPSFDSYYTGSLKPRNPQQYCAFDLLKNDKIPIKLITGRFGSGKSIGCISAALDAIAKNKFQKNCIYSQ